MGAAVVALADHLAGETPEPDGWVRAFEPGKPFRWRPDGDASREFTE